MKKPYMIPVAAISDLAANDLITTSGAGERSDDIGVIHSLIAASAQESQAEAVEH